MKSFLMYLTILAMTFSSFGHAEESCFIPDGMDTPMKICIDGNSISSIKQATADETAAQTAYTKLSDANVFYLLFAGVLVFFMQAGFSILEAGTVTLKSNQNILFKNIMDACLSAVGFWSFGYAFAYGKTNYGIIGSSNFFLTDITNDGATKYIEWFFQWAFAATAATIVSGSIAERCTLIGYLAYSIGVTSFIYPVVVHWCWSSDGWLSAFNEDKLFTNNMMDFAGSGVVHMTGGFSGLMAAMACGPRLGRFEEGGDEKYRPSNTLAAALGLIILWVGWYGFNVGSTLGVEYGSLGAKVAITTTLGGVSGGICSTLIARFTMKHWSLMALINGVLGGFVSITAGCAVVDPWAAVVIGIVGGFVLNISSAILKKLKIDDPLDAFPVHGACGFWGVVAVGIFGFAENIEFSYGLDGSAYTSGEQLYVQLIGACAIAGWICFSSGILFFGLKAAGVLRLSEEDEIAGADTAKHGGSGFNLYNGNYTNEYPLKTVN